MKKYIVSFLFSFSALASAPHQEALLKALDDEYKAKAVYQQVMQDFGQVRPFSNIVKSEQRHIDALLPLLKRYRVEVPANPYLGKVGFYNSIKEACLAGVQAEIDNIALYDEIESMVSQQDILDVFYNLRWASQERHLPAFQRCANRR
jgi:hypothetical protein